MTQYTAKVFFDQTLAFGDDFMAETRDLPAQSNH